MVPCGKARRAAGTGTHWAARGTRRRYLKQACVGAPVSSTGGPVPCNPPPQRSPPQHGAAIAPCQADCPVRSECRPMREGSAASAHTRHRHLPVERVADDRTMLAITWAGALAQLSERQVVGYGCVPERAKVPARPSWVAYPSSIGHLPPNAHAHTQAGAHARRVSFCQPAHIEQAPFRQRRLQRSSCADAALSERGCHSGARGYTTVPASDGEGVIPHPDRQVLAGPRFEPCAGQRAGWRRAMYVRTTNAHIR